MDLVSKIIKIWNLNIQVGDFENFKEIFKFNEKYMFI